MQDEQASRPTATAAAPRSARAGSQGSEVAEPLREPLPGAPDPMTPRRWAALGGLWLGLAALLALAQLGRTTSTVFVDELVFGRVAQNLAGGEGQTFQGLPYGVRTMYPYIISPAWMLADAAGAYRLALGINAVVMTSVVLAAFAIARRLAPFRWALAAAGCAAVVPSMAWAGMLMTESVAYPLAGAALAAMVLALRRPGLLTLAAVGVAVLLAYFDRTQLLSLAGVFGVALVLHVLSAGRGGIADRARAHRLPLAAAGVGAVGLGLLLTTRQEAFGTYACAVASAPSPVDIVRPAVEYVGTFSVATLCLPCIALVALAAGRRNWRDPELGPVLCVGVAASVVLIAQAAWTAVIISPERQDRYVFYAAPVLIALLPVLRTRASRRAVLVTAAGFALYGALLFSGFGDVTGEKVAARLGLPGLLGDAVGNDHLLWGATFAALGGAALLAMRAPAARGGVLVLATAALFGLGLLGVRQLDANALSRDLDAQVPQPKDLVDRLSDGGPAGVVVSAGSDPRKLFTLQLWNDSVDRAFRIGIADAYGAGQLCPLFIRRTGAAELEAPCAGRDLPRTLIMLEGDEGLRFANGRQLFAEGDVRILRFAPGEVPRLDLGTPQEAGRRASALKPPPAAPPPADPLDRCQ